MEYTEKQIKQFGIQYTPNELAVAVCKLVKDKYDPHGVLSRPGAAILEPTAGKGAFVLAAHQVFPTAWIDACEIFDEREALAKAGAGSVLIVDFLDDSEKGFKLATTATGYDLVLGNPPFKQAEAVVRKGIRLLRMGDREIHETSGGMPTGNVERIPAPAIHAMLINMTFEGTAERIEFWKQHPNYTSHTVIPRPSFSGAGSSDRMEYKIYVWHPGGQGKAGEPLVWREPKRRGIVGTIGDLVRGRRKRGVENGAATASQAPAAEPAPVARQPAASDAPPPIVQAEVCDDPW